MAFALVINAAKGDTDTIVTTGVDTTGANLIVVSVTHYNAVTASPTLTDSKSNTWTGRTAKTQGAVTTRLYDCLNPSVGASHTFTLTGTTLFGTVSVQAWSGAHASASFDQQNGAVSASANSLATGSVTPSEDNELLATGVMDQSIGAGTFSIDSSFTISNQDSGGASPAHYSGSMGYKVQTTAGAENPTWSWTSSDACVATIATYKAAAAGGGFFARQYYDRHIGGQ